MASNHSGPSRPQAVRHFQPPRLNAAQSAELRRKVEQAKPTESLFTRARKAASEQVSALLRNAKMDPSD